MSQFLFPFLLPRHPMSSSKTPVNKTLDNPKSAEPVEYNRPNQPNSPLPVAPPPPLPPTVAANTNTLPTPAELLSAPAPYHNYGLGTLPQPSPSGNFINWFTYLRAQPDTIPAWAQWQMTRIVGHPPTTKNPWPAAIWDHPAYTHPIMGWVCIRRLMQRMG